MMEIGGNRAPVFLTAVRLVEQANTVELQATRTLEVAYSIALLWYSEGWRHWTATSKIS
jgi:hypothetical protein